MTIDTHAAAAEHAARLALGNATKAANLRALEDLDTTANASQQADHIRGVVAATMSHRAADATSATRESAVQWQKWALGLSDAPAPAVNP